MENRQFEVDEENEGIRIDVYINDCLEELTRSQVQRLIKENEILIDGLPVKANYKIKKGDIISCNIPEPEPLQVQAEDIPLDIIYEDTDLLVVNKPQDMVVHPAYGNFKGTLVNALLYHCHDLSGINGVLRPGIVHRIDKDTSGLLVVAKNDQAHQGLAQQIKDHSVKREYIALLHGIMAEPGGVIETPIGRDPKDRQKMAVTTKNSKEAVTRYWVLERLNGYTLVKCRLETGRTHQIRVHMAYIGHPVVGDPKYGPKKPHMNLKGQALHAAVLGFVHPRSKEWLEFSAAPPETFRETLNILGSEYIFEEEKGDVRLE